MIDATRRYRQAARRRSIKQTCSLTTFQFSFSFFSCCWSSLVESVVNKDLTFKAKAKDLAFKAKAKDLAFKAKAKAKAKAKDLTSRTSSRTAFDKGVFEC